MAKNDIRPWRPASGGTQNIVAYPLGAGQAWEEGEPVVVVNGNLVLAQTPEASSVLGISAASSQGKTADGQDGVRPTGTLIQIYSATPEHMFISNNFSDGDTPRTPTASDIGEQAALRRIAVDGVNLWHVNINPGANQVAYVIDVLDANGQPVSDSNKRTVDTGTSVVFVFYGATA